jgi:hypothetical protein
MAINRPKAKQKSKGPPVSNQEPKPSAPRNRTDERLPADAFNYLGKALFGEDGWQPKMAQELKVDERTVRQWATEGPPASLSDTLSHMAGYHRGQIQAAITMPGMPDADLKPWERAERLLQEYEGFSQDPTMIYGALDNKQMVTQVAADLLHYCMHQNAKTDRFINMEDMIQEAIAIYNNSPIHSARPVKTTPWLTKDLIPYVLTASPAKIAEFQKKFGITQYQAVDEFIEESDWGGQDLPHLVGKKGIQADRLRELRRVLREAGQTEEERGTHLTTEYKTPEQDYPVLLKQQREWMREHMPKLLAGLEPLVKEYKLSDHDAHDLLFDAQCGHDSGVKDKNTIEGMAYDLKHGLRPEKK